MKQQRESNYELLRSIAILLVLILHANFFALEGPNVQDIINNPLDSILRIFFQAISIVCVNVFVMISGWFGIRPSRRGFCNLLFQIIFYLFLIYLLFILTGHAILSTSGILDLLLATPSNWFLKAYICLYLFAPVLNSFVEYASQKEFKFFLISFFLFQTIYGWIFTKSTDYIQGGYSPLSFMGLYLLARYIRIYKPSWSLKPLKIQILYYLSLLALVVGTCIIPPHCFHASLTMIYGYNLLTYISPTTILMASLMVTLTSKLHYRSKAINWIASSSFAVYMVYVNPHILTPYRNLFQEIHADYQGIIYWMIVILLSLLMYFGVIIIDQIRKYLWDKLFIRLIT